MLAADIHFAQKVGVAPSTTTIDLSGGNELGIQCYPVPSPTERALWLGKLRTQLTPSAPGPAAQAAPAAAKRRRLLNPYGSEVEMRGPLGVVDPNDAWRTGDVARMRMHGTTTVLINPRRGGGYDSSVLTGGLGITNGEMNRSLSGLGTIPNDDELARNLCYTPVHSGWIYGNTPTGRDYYVDGFYGADEDPAIKHARRGLIFQGIATAAIVTLAGVAIYNAATASKGRGGLLGAARRRKRRRR